MPSIGNQLEYNAKYGYRDGILIDVNKLDDSGIEELLLKINSVTGVDVLSVGIDNANYKPDSYYVAVVKSDGTSMERTH